MDGRSSNIGAVDVEDYGTVRPRLAAAPAAVRHAVARLLGGPVVAETPASAGFTPSIASVVVGGTGERLFIKAAPLGAGLGEAVEAGVLLSPATDGIGPKLLGSAAVGTWRVAAYEVIDGEAVTTWTMRDCAQLPQVLQRLRERSEPCPVPGTTPYAVAFLPLLGTWQALVNPTGALSGSVEHVRGRALPVDVPIAELAELENRWLPALASGTALHHGDLRRDNVIREPDGQLRIVDWTHLWTAPGWLDLVRLAPDIAACGHDPEQLLRRSCWSDAPADSINVALAGLAGRAWRDGNLPDIPELPGLRRMQREQGLHTMRWLQARLSRRR